MIKEVDIDYLNKVIENMLGYYGEMVYAFNGDIWVACDNSSGDAWTEEFQTKEDAIQYLTAYYGDDEL